MLRERQGEPPNEMFDLFPGAGNGSFFTSHPDSVSIWQSPCGSLPALGHPAAAALTFSKTPVVAGQLEGSWHTHMGELLSSTSHTLPCLQWWFWQGSAAGGEQGQSQPHPHFPRDAQGTSEQREDRDFARDSPQHLFSHREDVKVSRSPC